MSDGEQVEVYALEKEGSSPAPGYTNLHPLREKNEALVHAYKAARLENWGSWCME